MKILATGDWHIGKYLYKNGRANEHRHFLEWLIGRAVETQADALLVTGDIFDSKDPTPSSQEIYYTFLDEITHTCPDLQIIMIAGNHDNPTLLEAPQSILKRHRVVVLGTAEGCNEVDQSKNPLIIPVVNKNSERAWVIAVPYLRRSNFEFDQSYEKSVADYLSTLVRAARAKSRKDEPVIMIAHLYAAGALSGNDEERSETIFVGGEPEIRMTNLTDHPDYLLSGHIHKRMAINGVPWAQYTGSALTMSFSEVNYVHGVDLLTFESGKEIVHDFIEYTPMMKFITYGPASPEEITKKIQEDLPRLNSNMFIQTRVILDSAESDIKTMLEKTIKKIGAKFVYAPELKEKEQDNGRYSNISKPEDLSSDDIIREVILRRFAIANGRDSSDGADIMNEEELTLLSTIISKARSINFDE